MDDDDRPDEPTEEVPPPDATQQAPRAEPVIPPMPAGAQVVYGPPAPTNGLATAALVCGIVGVVLCWTVWLGLILGILAVVFGAVGRGRAAQGAPNRDQATAGMWLGIASLVLSILIVGLVTSWVGRHQVRIINQIERCMDNPDAC